LMDGKDTFWFTSNNFTNLKAVSTKVSFVWLREYNLD
jgi:hypothetical protein